MFGKNPSSRQTTSQAQQQRPPQIPKLNSNQIDNRPITQDQNQSSKRDQRNTQKQTNNAPISNRSNSGQSSGRKLSNEEEKQNRSQMQNLDKKNQMADDVFNQVLLKQQQQQMPQQQQQFQQQIQDYNAPQFQQYQNNDQSQLNQYDFQQQQQQQFPQQIPNPYRNQMMDPQIQQQKFIQEQNPYSNQNSINQYHSQGDTAEQQPQPVVPKQRSFSRGGENDTGDKARQEEMKRKLKEDLEKQIKEKENKKKMDKQKELEYDLKFDPDLQGKQISQQQQQPPQNKVQINTQNQSSYGQQPQYQQLQQQQQFQQQFQQQQTQQNFQSGSSKVNDYQENRTIQQQDIFNDKSQDERQKRQEIQKKSYQEELKMQMMENEKKKQQDKERKKQEDIREQQKLQREIEEEKARDQQEQQSKSKQSKKNQQFQQSTQQSSPKVAYQDKSENLQIKNNQADKNFQQIQSQIKDQYKQVPPFEQQQQEYYDRTPETVSQHYPNPNINQLQQQQQMMTFQKQPQPQQQFQDINMQQQQQQYQQMQFQQQQMVQFQQQQQMQLQQQQFQQNMQMLPVQPLQSDSLHQLMKNKQEIELQRQIMEEKLKIQQIEMEAKLLVEQYKQKMKEALNEKEDLDKEITTLKRIIESKNGEKCDQNLISQVYVNTVQQSGYQLFKNQNQLLLDHQHQNINSLMSRSNVMQQNQHIQTQQQNFPHQEPKKMQPPQTNQFQQIQTHQAQQQQQINNQKLNQQQQQNTQNFGNNQSQQQSQFIQLPNNNVFLDLQKQQMPQASQNRQQNLQFDQSLAGDTEFILAKNSDQQLQNSYIRDLQAFKNMQQQVQSSGSKSKKNLKQSKFDDQFLIKETEEVSSSQSFQQNQNQYQKAQQDYIEEQKQEKNLKHFQGANEDDDELEEDQSMEEQSQRPQNSQIIPQSQFTIPEGFETQLIKTADYFRMFKEHIQCDEGGNRISKYATQLVRQQTQEQEQDTDTVDESIEEITMNQREDGVMPRFQIDQLKEIQSIVAEDQHNQFSTNRKKKQSGEQSQHSDNQQHLILDSKLSQNSKEFSQVNQQFIYNSKIMHSQQQKTEKKEIVKKELEEIPELIKQDSSNYESTGRQHTNGTIVQEIQMKNPQFDHSEKSLELPDDELDPERVENFCQTNNASNLQNLNQIEIPKNIQSFQKIQEQQQELQYQQQQYNSNNSNTSIQMKQTQQKQSQQYFNRDASENPNISQNNTQYSNKSGQEKKYKKPKTIDVFSKKQVGAPSNNISSQQISILEKIEENSQKIINNGNDIEENQQEFGDEGIEDCSVDINQEQYEQDLKTDQKNYLQDESSAYNQNPLNSQSNTQNYGKFSNNGTSKLENILGSNDREENLFISKKIQDNTIQNQKQRILKKGLPQKNGSEVPEEDEISNQSSQKGQNKKNTLTKNINFSQQMQDPDIQQQEQYYEESYDPQKYLTLDQKNNDQFSNINNNNNNVVKSNDNQSHHKKMFKGPSFGYYPEQYIGKEVQKIISINNKQNNKK